MIRSEKNRKKRIEAIAQVIRERKMLCLEDVNGHLRDPLKFANPRELSQVARQVRPMFAELEWSRQQLP